METKNWAEVPRELLGRILNKLCINSIDSFKLVCRSWHSSFQEEAHLSLLRPVPSPPWLTIPIHEEESESRISKKKDLLLARFYNPTNNKLHSFRNEEMKRWFPDPAEAVCVGSSHGWLAFIDTRCVIYLTNPFKRVMIQLPSIESLPCILGVERERSSGSIINFKLWDYHMDMTFTQPPSDMFDIFLEKLVFSSAPDDDDNDYTVMLIYGPAHDLAFCKSGDTSWTSLHHATRSPLDNATRPSPNHATQPPLQGYQDIYYSSNDQCFYAYRRSGSFEIWDLRNPSSPKSTYIDLMFSVPPSLTRHEKWLRSWCIHRKMYLVNFYGDLLLTVKYVAEQVLEDGQINTKDDGTSRPYRTLRFDVYKLDWVQKQWVHVTYLGNGDGVLFVGINNAMTFSACDFPALRGNSIYFTDDIFDLRTRDGPYGGHDLGIFSLEDNSIHPCFYPAGDCKRISPPPVWLAPNPW